MDLRWSGLCCNYDFQRAAWLATDEVSVLVVTDRARLKAELSHLFDFGRCRSFQQPLRVIVGNYWH
ncbi:hypothetical protein A9K69_19905 [Stenotrophomonas maltophilia]|nr:hypothetical protein A9K69_19905 [Stenotrophomonas maltophilia]OBU63781.1 hypothetical protein A9J40_17515 [Stenotrophomonas maltophilia]